MPLPRITPDQIAQLAAACEYTPALNDALVILHEVITATDNHDVDNACDAAAKSCYALAEQAKVN